MLEESQIRQRFVDFESSFGRGGVIDLYFAPGRINIIGEHTDYNGGYVLPIAVGQGTYLMIRKSELAPARLYSENLDLDARIYPSDISRTGDWADYVRGVYLYARDICEDLPPFDALYFGDLPLDSGLSSSASIEVVTALAMESLGCSMDQDDIVMLGLRAENDFMGKPCSVMDQFSVAYAKKGHALFLNAETLDYRYVPFNLKDATLMVGQTGVRCSLPDTEYHTRRHECEEALELLSGKLGPKKTFNHITINEFERARYSLPPTLEKRAEHIIYENVRVEEAARCIEAGDSETLGHLMNRSHESLRDLYEVSCPELDALQEISIEQQGVLGCHMTGAGFGRCVITLMKKDAVERYLRRVPGLYWQSTHYDGEFVVTVPGEGARKL
jgi:galactokinase